MQENILEANPEAELDVYVVWEPMLGARRHHADDAMELISDSRVQHYWNDDFIVGEHFKDHHFGRTAWDIYFLYGPEAVWQEEPEPLIISGFTVIRKRQALQDALLELWQEKALGEVSYYSRNSRTELRPSSRTRITYRPAIYSGARFQLS